MNIDITNGAAVSGFYSDGSGELLAIFQYAMDADRWAEQYVANMDKGVAYSLYRTCLHSGKSKVFHPQPDVSERTEK